MIPLIPAPTAETLKGAPLVSFVSLIRRDLQMQKKPVPFGAVPYLSALGTMNNLSDRYGVETGAQILPYLLSNLSTYRGPIARLVKAELNARLKDYYKNNPVR